MSLPPRNLAGIKHLLRLTAVPAGLALLLAAAPVLAQDPQNPCGGQRQQPPAATPEPELAPSQEGQSHLDSGDPFLKYAENVKLRVSQVDLRNFPTVRAFASVTDENGITIRTLKEGDFNGEENGVPITDIRFGNRDELDLPLQVIFVVDISGSMDPAIQAEFQAVRDFIGRLQPRDRVGLITFSDAAISEASLTTDHEQVIRRLEGTVAFGQTALWDGIFLGMEELLRDEDPGRKALIVMSDGLDNKSRESPQTVLKYYEDVALENNQGFSIFALGLGQQIDRSALGSLSSKTGGAYLDSPTAEDLGDVYQQILSQIQGEYLLEYTSPVESENGQIIDLRIGLVPVRSFEHGAYPYRSPGLSKALGRAILPGLIAIVVMTLLLILATIYKLTRQVWLTVMITPLEGKDIPIRSLGCEIGTLESCEARVARDPALLPLHAVIKESSDGYILEAVDPAAPIIMGQQLLARKLLRSGDRFILGTTEFVFSERVYRPGDGQAVAVDAMYALPGEIEPLTEQMLRGAADAAGAGPLPRALRALSGPLAGQVVALKESGTVFGRIEGDVLLGADAQVSRRHCELRLASGALIVEDLGSTNGTRLNGDLLQPRMAVALKNGDRLGIGLSEFVLE